MARILPSAWARGWSVRAMREPIRRRIRSFLQCLHAFSRCLDRTGEICVGVGAGKSAKMGFSLAEEPSALKSTFYAL
jgi:hypothetical protein